MRTFMIRMCECRPGSGSEAFAPRDREARIGRLDEEDEDDEDDDEEEVEEVKARGASAKVASEGARRRNVMVPDSKAVMLARLAEQPSAKQRAHSGGSTSHVSCDSVG